jgi:hypothetical protein
MQRKRLLSFCRSGLMIDRFISPSLLRIGFATICLFCVEVCYAQRMVKRYKQDSAYIADLEFRQIELDYSSMSLEPGFRAFDLSFRDVRRNKTCIGVVGKTPKRIVFKDSLQKILEQKLEGSFDNSNGNNSGKLLLFIKRLRISMADSFPKFERLNNTMLQLSAELEAYYGSADKWYPAFRIDTTYINLEEEVKDISLLVKPFTDAILSKINSLNTDKLLKRNTYSEEQLVQRYIYTPASFFENGVPQKGAYLSFEEFKMNTPSITNVEFKADFLGLYYVKSDSIFNSNKTFAYSDGTRTWINTKQGFYPLVKTEGGFEFYGLVNRQRNKQLPSVDMNTHGVVTSLQMANLASRGVIASLSGNKKAVHFLDMNTGDIY